VSKLKTGPLIVSVINIVIVAAAIFISFRAGFSYGAKSALYDESNDHMSAEMEMLKSEFAPLETQMEGLNQEFGPLKDMIEKYSGAGLIGFFDGDKPYVKMPFIAETDVLVLAHPNFPPEVVELLTNHMKALYSGDRDALFATMNGDFEYVGNMLKEPGERQLRCVIIDSSANSEEETYMEQGYFYTVCAFSRERVNLDAEFYRVGVTKESGRLFVYGHD
jgi:cell division protein FtsB